MHRHICLAGIPGVVCALRRYNSHMMPSFAPMAHAMWARAARSLASGCLGMSAFRMGHTIVTCTGSMGPMFACRVWCTVLGTLCLERFAIKLTGCWSIARWQTLMMQLGRCWSMSCIEMHAHQAKYVGANLGHRPFET